MSKKKMSYFENNQSSFSSDSDYSEVDNNDIGDNSSIPKNPNESLSTHNKYENKGKRKKGNLGTKLSQRRKIKDQKDDVSDELHLQLSAEKTVSPSILFELSKMEYHKLKKNIIHLSSCMIEKDNKKSILHKQTLYNNITYGESMLSNDENIKKKTLKMKDINETIDIDLINIQGLKKSMIIITTDKENVNMVSKNCIIITSKVTPTERNGSFKGSGKV